MEFNIIDNAVSTQSRTSSSKYVATLDKLAISTKNEDGTFSGSAVELDKAGQVLSFRQAAKKLGVGIVTRKQGDKTRVWKVATTDLAVRKVSEKPATPKVDKAKKSKPAKA